MTPPSNDRIIVRLLPILGITFIDILGFSILIPLLPFFVKRFGSPDVVVGALFAVFALCQLIGAPLWGNLSDRIGRKAVLIVSQIGATIGWTMLAFAPTIGWVFVARIIEGLSGGNISVTQAYVADLVAPEQRGRAFSYIGAAFGAGLVFGPAAGGLLVAHYGFSVPFLLAAGLQVVTLIVTLVILPESRQPTDEQPASFTAIREALTNDRIAPTMWQKLVFALGLYGWFASFTLILQQQLGFNESSTSFFFAAFGVANVVMQIFAVGRMTDALNDRRTSNIGFAAIVLAMGIVPFTHTTVVAVIMVALFSFGLACANAALPSLMSSLAPDNLRGTVLGAASSLESVAGVIMPLVTTYVLERAGVAPTVAITAGFISIALVMGLVQVRRDRTIEAKDAAHNAA